METKSIRLLQVLAIVSGIAVAVAMIWDKNRNLAPGEAAHTAAHDAFNDGKYKEAADLFTQALQHNKTNLGAQRGLANSLVQLGRFDEAYAAIGAVVTAEPDNACNYAIRGIIEDHRGNHKQALANYERAVAGCKVARHGMSWWQRVLTNTHNRPPTVADRLTYLKAQMALPEDQRVLNMPAIDRAQKPYEG